ncbi:MAG: hypothetical protein CPSOU_4101 [uncultured Paraburkholderia sp.]|nr:MAG: hypothetical protein CPSOU_4101 [uncultured Paraburkholderia sp.]
MNFDVLLDELASLLEVPPGTLSPEDELDRFETWDSLTKVSLIGVCQDHYACAVDGTVFDHVRTVGDLLRSATSRQPRRFRRHMNTSLSGVAIRAVAAALPARTLSFSELEQSFGALEIKRITRSTGIHAVRVADALTTGDLCVAAGESLFDKAGIDRSSIDGLVVVTQTPDFAMPATSALVANRLGMRRDVVTFDINHGCSGYVYGLYQGAMLVTTGGCTRVLVCTGDVITKLLNHDDRHVRLVFGDAAATRSNSHFGQTALAVTS